MDAQRLEQVIWNMLNNAVKFSSEGEKVEVKTYREGDALITSVTDQGPGIEPRHREIIFEIFRQVDGSTTRQYGGVGIGLALARHFVEAHGGRIWVESELGQGSTFYISIPTVAGKREFTDN